jgi:putative spermidine/putrescine transport system permease protein
MVPLIASNFPTFLPKNGGIGNYIAFFQDEYNRGIFWRTIRVSGIVTIISLILGIPTAYFIAGLQKKWRGILMAMTLFPLLTNSVIRSFAWINILGKNGVINNFLLSVGIIDQPLSLLYT